MLSTIKFNYDLPFKTHKIHDMSANDGLPPKFNAKIIETKHIPKTLFGFRKIVSQFSGRRR